MKNVIRSASKIVFIMMATGINIALFVGKINGDQYMMLAAMAFAFYFSKSNSSTTTSSGPSQ